MIYRGYVIKQGKGQWDIEVGGKHVCSQPSEEFALKWIDAEKKKQREAAEQKA